jgi:hypothetical protein
VRYKRGPSQPWSPHTALLDPDGVVAGVGIEAAACRGAMASVVSIAHFATTSMHTVSLSSTAAWWWGQHDPIGAPPTEFRIHSPWTST